MVEARPGNYDVQLEALARALSDHMRFDRDRAIDQQDVLAVASAIVQANPELAQSRTWRIAQEKLNGALERPEVIGLSVGVISALPRLAQF
jgi:hypothetical protein